MSNLRQLVSFSAKAAIGLNAITFVSSTVLSVGTLATLFVSSPFIEYQTERAIAGFLLNISKVTAITGVGSVGLGLLAYAVTSGVEDSTASVLSSDNSGTAWDEVITAFPEAYGPNPCIFCKYYSVEMRPCAVYPRGKPAPDCIDWETKLEFPLEQSTSSAIEKEINGNSR